MNADVCYLGFPYSNYKILFEKHNITRYEETEKSVVIYDCPPKQDFVEWKDLIELPTVEDITPQMLLRPDVKAKDLKNLQIYKSGYDVMVELHRYAGIMPRTHRYTIGERIKNESIELAVAAYRIGRNNEVERNKLIVIESIEIIRLLLRFLRHISATGLFIIILSGN